MARAKASAKDPTSVIVQFPGTSREAPKGRRRSIARMTADLAAALRPLIRSEDMIVLGGMDALTPDERVIRMYFQQTETDASVIEMFGPEFLDQVGWFDRDRTK